MSNTAVAQEHHAEHPRGIWRWISTTNHKDIGTLYLLFSLVMFFVGGAMAMVIRLELLEPGIQYVNPIFFNSKTTMHFELWKGMSTLNPAYWLYVK